MYARSILAVAPQSVQYMYPAAGSTAMARGSSSAELIRVRGKLPSTPTTPMTSRPVSVKKTFCPIQSMASPSGTERPFKRICLFVPFLFMTDIVSSITSDQTSCSVSAKKSTATARDNPPMAVITSAEPLVREIPRS